MKIMALYLKIGDDFTLYFTATTTPDNTSQLFDSNGRLDWDVVQKKRKEIFGEASRLTSGGIKPFPAHFRSSVKRHTLAVNKFG